LLSKDGLEGAMDLAWVLEIEGDDALGDIRRCRTRLRGDDGLDELGPVRLVAEEDGDLGPGVVDLAWALPRNLEPRAGASTVGLDDKVVLGLGMDCENCGCGGHG